MEEHLFPGIYERRLRLSDSIDFYAALRMPENLARMHVVFPLEIAVPPKITLKGMTLEFEVNAPGITTVVLQLTQESFDSIFGVLVADVVDACMKGDANPDRLKKLIRRIQHWQKFLEQMETNGLTPQQQVGLYGELLLLLQLLKAGGDAVQLVNAWNGPDAANHDFSVGLAAIEVKSTSSNDMSSFVVSNEFQLDVSNLESLVICHFCFDVRGGAPKSLPRLVGEIFAELDPICCDEFDGKLLNAGYHVAHAHLYDAVGYLERQQSFYRVRSGFPALTPANLPAGICETKYRVRLDGCASFQIAHSEGLVALLGALHD